MFNYSVPSRDFSFLHDEVFEINKRLGQLPTHADFPTEAVKQLIEEAAKFAVAELLPLNSIGDSQGCQLLPGGVVRMPDGFETAWAKFVKSGWCGMSCDPLYGGQGLPITVSNAIFEIFYSCNKSFSMIAGLTRGAYELLATCGSKEQKTLYLPKLASGEWTGTMCLTEAHSGTDLGLMRTKAEANPDGTYKINGNKIFISGGEHELSSNIVHLVLARTGDSTRGTSGLSLFVVPKFLPTDSPDNSIRNGVQAVALEHKMGIHANPTCALAFEDATGWLVGELNQGLAGMFVMMNTARLGIATESLGVAEAAYQRSFDYANERLQGRASTGKAAPSEAADPIIVHPDVRRMLLTQRAYNEGARGLCGFLSVLMDDLAAHPEEQRRQDSQDLISLLTPVAKAFVSDNAWQGISEGMQVFGGHGYIRDWGMEQLLREQRINLLYEGTNGIQALDLLGRKVINDNGKKLKKLSKLIEAFIVENEDDESMEDYIEPISKLLKQIKSVTIEVGMKALSNQEEVGAVATDYLRIIGHLMYGWIWAQCVRSALNGLKANPVDAPFYQEKVRTANFYFARLFPEVSMLLERVRSGVAPLKMSYTA